MILILFNLRLYHYDIIYLIDIISYVCYSLIKIVKITFMKYIHT